MSQFNEQHAAGASDEHTPTSAGVRTAAGRAAKSVFRRIITFAILIAVSIGIYTWRKSSQRSSADSETLGATMTMVAGLPSYGANKEFLDAAARLAHKAAFDRTFEAGGRRSAGRIDGEAYMQGVLISLVNRCRADNREDLAKEVALVSVLNGVPPEAVGLKDAPADPAPAPEPAPVGR